MKPIIRVDNVSKRYQLGQSQARYSTLRDSIVDSLKAPFRMFGNRQNQPETLWALKNIGFEITPGEVVGLIGRNGAGKSTTLKLLSRITEPSEGKIEIFGRLGSLLEVGTGFHPELTGRENVFLNGAILGMRKAEIESRFDEIVEFAELERFLDTPVKYYSSGMYMRLAFAVASNLDSDILIVDEVLAVGDTGFQKKCLGKIEDIRSHGKTVIFVSHNMPLILRLCQRAILLHQGQVLMDGPAHEVTKRYLRSDIGSSAERIWTDRAKAPGDGKARLNAIRVKNGDGEVVETVDIRESIDVEVEYWHLNGNQALTVSLHFTNEDGTVLFSTNDFVNREWWNAARQPGLVRSTCRLPGNFFAEGQIFILVAICSYSPDSIHALERDAVAFQVVDRSEGDGVRGPFGGNWVGVVRPMLRWDVDIKHTPDEQVVTAKA